MNHGRSAFSHKDRRLEHHLLHSLELAEMIAARFGLEIDQGAQRAILMHDLAKAHPLFQRHLLQHKGKFGHAEPSAALVFGLTGDLWCAEAVRRHHSNLNNLQDAMSFWSCWDYQKQVPEVLEKIPVWDGAEQVEDKLGKRVERWSDLLPSADEWEELIFHKVLACELKHPELDWLRLRILYSLLVLADRYDAAVGDDISYEDLVIDLDRVTAYAASLKGRPLAEWRQQVREEVFHKASKVLNSPGVYTLTLPTGAGKTLTGLQVAMMAAERMGATGIVYVLPFVSLVEQNVDVARSVFNGIATVREDHHLSTDTNNITEEVTPQERFLAFFRYWKEPVVVTTLAKLWEVLYSPHGNDTMSFHRLSRAVVILDEPQAIPPKYWQGFGETLHWLAQQLGTVFILMTATQPEIAKGIELTPRTYQFPRVRHCFHWQAEKKSLPDLVEQLLEWGMREKSTLLVLNTRKEALLAYEELCRRGITPFFLSSWVTPVDRRRILKQLQMKERAGERRWLVSTQVVEAGVDLDFQMAFRDLGPLDSIIQVAGRCNRHGCSEPGKVFIVELHDQNGRSYASYVYDSNLLVATRAILKENFDEQDCPDLVSSYYRKVREITANDQLWSDIKNGRWGERHNLIEQEDRDEALLVVAYEGVNLDLELLSSQSGPGEGVMRMLEIKRAVFRRISQHSIKVPAKALEKWSLLVGGMIFDSLGDEPLKEVLTGIWLVQGSGIGRIYSHDIGFLLPARKGLWESEDNGW